MSIQSFVDDRYLTGKDLSNYSGYANTKAVPDPYAAAVTLDTIDESQP